MVSFKFKFKSKKGSEFNVDYTPHGTKVMDKTLFEKHLVGVADLLECEGKLAKTGKRPEEPKKEEPKEEPKAEVKKEEVKAKKPQTDLFGKGKV